MKFHSLIASYIYLFFTILSAALTLFFIMAGSAHAQQINGAKILSGQTIEGGLIIAHTDPANHIMLANEPVSIAENGIFVVGFHRDSDKPLILTITTPDGQSMNTTLVPDQRNYKIQRIDGLKSAMVTPPKTVLARIKADGRLVKAARKIYGPLGDFWEGFDWPARGAISGVYGSQRILNGEPRQPHYGIDIAGPRGTPVYAPANGFITLVKDLYFSGWTIIMTHGLSVNSSFLHLDQVKVKEGMFVERGALIGTIGATGRATGPHLDWRIDWKGRRIDAGLLVGKMQPQ